MEINNAPDWKEYVYRQAPLLIYYPICGGGEECITACPQKEKIWKIKSMKVPFVMMEYKVRLRPVLTNPDECKRCYLCVKACPTGALRTKEKYPPKHQYLTLIYNILKLPFKKKYGLKFTFSREHLEKTKRTTS